MTKIAWLWIILAVTVAVAANTFSAKWADKGFGYTSNFWIMLILSPLVFITFGLVSSKLGMSGASAVVDSLLTIVSVLVGFTMLKSMKEIPIQQYAGIGFCVLGIVLMHYKK